MTDAGTGRPTLSYPQNDQAELDLVLFRNPTAVYRGAPFWAWNGRLERERLSRQIAVFKAMGMGGFHMHARTGLATAYLSDEFMEMVRHCVEEAERQGMLAWLYDEDRYPSGFAGGLVTREPQFRAQYLRLVPHALDLGGQNDRRFFACYHVVLDAGYLTRYCMHDPNEPAPEGGMLWYCYLERWAPASWYNQQTYVDTLSRAAIERFIAVTHERYAQSVGSYFGRVIPAIFSDESQFTKERPLAEPIASDGAILPWTDDLPVSYRACYGTSLEVQLPELFWERPGDDVSVVRYQFHDHIAERIAQAFSDTVGEVVYSP